jgi:hypothetical protein
MRLTRKKANIVRSAINAWVAEDNLSAAQGQRLLDGLEVIRFDWKRLAKYSFWISISCIIIAVAAILADEALRQLLVRLFRAPVMVKCLAFAIVAALIYAAALHRRKKSPTKVFSNEALFFLGVLSTAACIAFLGQALDSGSGHFSILLLLAAIVYGLLGLWFPSTLIWIFALLSLGSWLGAETGYMSGWGAYYLGMNYPLRFVFLGAALTLAASAFSAWPIRQNFQKPTRTLGLLYLFIALWIMSIFGNYGDVDVWYRVRQWELLPWSLLFAVAALLAVGHGIKTDDSLTRGFGITFFFINLYTRFFEYFWDQLHKAIFFALLAVSFWLVGSRAESIWNLGRLKRLDKEKK